jgi:hypothetical protein
MDDALEILNELEDLIDDLNNPFDVETLRNYIEQKRTEFEPSHGDCCG